jgi:formyl-CoA transferase
MPALDTTKVLDFSQVIFGATASQVLADHGADVTKIERPGQGDLSRAFGPWQNGQSLPFASINRSKRSLTINLKTPAGLKIVHRLLKSADVLLHNFRPGVMEKLGLDYPTLKVRYPRLVYAVGSGYGTQGPYAERNKAGHESMAQALSGLVDRFIGPHGIPQRLPYTLADFTGGMLLAQGILLALLARERSGCGQELETSLLDGVMSLQAWETTTALNTQGPQDHGAGGATDPLGNPLDGAVFATADGYLMVTALFRPVDQLMVSLGRALETPTLGTDPRFQTLDGLKAHRQQLRDTLAPILATRTNDTWIARLEAEDILCAPVRSTSEALADPQLAVNNLLVEVEHPQAGTFRHIGTPLRLKGTPAAKAKAAPVLGEHTDEILRQAGYRDEEVAAFRAQGIID